MPLTGRHLGKGPRVVILEVTPIQPNRNDSSPRHRIARVDREIHQYLLDLSRVRHGNILTGLNLGADQNRLGDDPLEHGHGFLDDQLETKWAAFAD